MRTETRSFYATAVQRCIDLIVDHLDDAIDLERLANEACLSSFHFHRVFLGMVGETPMQFVRRIRLERAAWRLAHTQQYVTRIAFDAGYEAHETFTRAFRSHYDTSPSGFRERRHPRIELAAPCGVHFRPDGRSRPFTQKRTEGETMDVTIRDLPQMRLATVHHRGPYNQIPLAFERLGQILGGAAETLARGGAAMVALYHDDPESVPADQLRSDAAVTVPAGFVLPSGLTEQTIPMGTYACAVHVGPYELLGDAWSRLMGEWLPASGRRVGDGPSYERYLNDPRSTPREELQTELCVPLLG